MMLPSLALSLLAAQAPSPTARLVGASLFKNGFAVTQRIVEVPKPGTTTVVPIPQGAMGTLWFTPSAGTTLDSVTVENADPKRTELPLGSLDAILVANVGQIVTLTLKETETSQKLVCRIVSAAGAVVLVETQGRTRAIAKTAVVGIEGKGLKSTGEGFAPTGRVMRLHTSGKPGQVAIVALERGLSWSPAYAVTLLPDGKTLDLVAKATVVNDLERLTTLDCKFVTGFPNLPFAYELDPLVAFNGFVRQDGMDGRFLNQAVAKAAVPASIDFISADPTDNSLLVNGQRPDGEYQGELFFYRRPNVTLSLGGRAAYTLFRTTAPYETVYAWDLADPAPGQSVFQPRVLPPGAPSPEEVWQTLQFENTAKLPLTTAPATTFSGGQIVGQDVLKYASAGGPVELRVTRSLDVAPDFLEEETGRERGFVKYDNNNARYDRVTVRGTLTLVNRKSSAVRVRIRKAFTGEWIAGDGEPKVTRTAAGLRQPNPTGLAEWTKTVAPGETLKIGYTVRLLVNA